MGRAEKSTSIAEFREKLSGVRGAVLTDFRGLSVADITELLSLLRKSEVEYKVVKNTLLDLAARETDKESLSPHYIGPTAIAFSYDDPVAAAKVLSRFAKEQQAAFRLKAGILSGKVISVADIQALADLPSREVLIAKLLGTMQAPATNFVGVLAAVPASFVRLLDAIKTRKEGNLPN